MVRAEFPQGFLDLAQGRPCASHGDLVWFGIDDALQDGDFGSELLQKGLFDDFKHVISPICPDRDDVLAAGGRLCAIPRPILHQPAPFLEQLAALIGSLFRVTFSQRSSVAIAAISCATWSLSMMCGPLFGLQSGRSE